MSTVPIITTKNLKKSFRKKNNKAEIIRGIDLNINKSEFVAIMGASGSGKSTLLHLLSGLDHPTSGEITINNTNLSELSDARLSEFRGKTAGFIFQSFYLQPFLNILENVEVPAMFAQQDPSKRRARAQQLLKVVGLENKYAHLPSQLSGGQLQRACIARSLINHPQIIFADEPTGNLDSKNTAIIVKLLHYIRTKLGTTIILVTHDQSIASQADRIIRIVDGEIKP